MRISGQGRPEERTRRMSEKCEKKDGTDGAGGMDGTLYCSPRPWHIGSDGFGPKALAWYVFDADGRRVTGGFFSREDATLICEAVNGYKCPPSAVAAELANDRQSLRDATHDMLEKARKVLAESNGEEGGNG